MKFRNLCSILAFSASVYNASAQSVLITYEYDALGRLIEVVDPHAGDRSYELDDAGNRTNMSVAGSGGNQPPIAQNLTWYFDPGECDSMLHAIYVASDPDGDPLIYTFVSSGAIVNGGASWSYCAPPNDGDEVTYTFTVSDGNGGTASGSLHIIVEL